MDEVTYNPDDFILGTGLRKGWFARDLTQYERSFRPLQQGDEAHKQHYNTLRAHLERFSLSYLGMSIDELPTQGERVYNIDGLISKLGRFAEASGQSLTTPSAHTNRPEGEPNVWDFSQDLFALIVHLGYASYKDKNRNSLLFEGRRNYGRVITV